MAEIILETRKCIVSNIAPLQKIMIEAIQDPRSSAPVVAELAEAVAADVRHSMWFAELKERVHAQDPLKRLEDYENAVNVCQTAWARYVEAHSSAAEAAFLQSVSEMRRMLDRQSKR